MMLNIFSTKWRRQAADSGCLAAMKCYFRSSTIIVRIASGELLQLKIYIV